MKARLPEGYGKQSRSQVMEKFAKMQEAQEQLQTKEYTASAGGGMVEATVTGAHKVLSVTIKPEVCDPEDTEMLGDLVAAAVNAAIDAASEDYTNEMQKYTAGLDMGGLI